jgi:hypothetical protein
MQTNEGLMSWVDGFMLGDGHISQQAYHAFARMSAKHIGWAKFAMSGFSMFDLSEPHFNTIWHKTLCKEYTSWSIHTRSYPFFTEQRDRWYPDGIKRIPQDVRADEKSLLLWYLGDGNLDDNTVSIAAYDFTENENAFLAERFYESLGIRFTLHMSKGHKSKLYLPAEYLDKFFDAIGRVDPTGCYGYKFQLSRAQTSKSLNHFCKEVNVPHSWASFILKSGRVEFSKNGEMIYLSEKGKEQLREIIKNEYRPHGKETLSILTQQQVLEELHVHPRRILPLIAAAGINPRKTPGGQWRFTREEVEKMRPLSLVRKNNRFPQNAETNFKISV